MSILDTTQARPSTAIGAGGGNDTPIHRAFSNALPYAASDRKKLELDKRIAEMICVDLQPYNCVEKIGFQRLVQTLDPRLV